MLLSDAEIARYEIVRKGTTLEEGKVKWKNILSYGYSSAGYDARLGSSFMVQPDYGRVKRVIDISQDDISKHFAEKWREEHGAVVVHPGTFVLAHTLERFRLPINVIGVVRDKSTLARLGIAVQNTVLEPGWQGSVTLEISNHNRDPIWLEAGMPIAQIQFELIRGPVHRPYSGRYQDQPSSVVPPKPYE